MVSHSEIEHILLLSFYLHVKKRHYDGLMSKENTVSESLAVVMAFNLPVRVSIIT